MKNFLIFAKKIILGLSLTVWPAAAQQIERVELGHLATGATVSFIRAIGAEWGIEIVMLSEPVAVIFYHFFTTVYSYPMRGTKRLSERMSHAGQG